MFSGQGSQYYHMGEELYKKNDIFRYWMLKMDKFVSDNIGVSVIDLLYQNDKRKFDKFDRALYSFPALFMVEYSLYQILLNEGIKPDYLLGSSSGEFTAAAVAGVDSYEELLFTLITLARIFEKTCHNGGMLAVLESPDIFFKYDMLNESCEIAAYNFNSHFVISGKNGVLKRLKKELKNGDIICQTLPVSFAYHSKMINPAESAFKDHLKKKKYSNSKYKIASCVRGKIENRMKQDHFWDVVKKPILFQKTIKALEEKDSCFYLDLGPSGTLATFVKYILKKNEDSNSLSILNLYTEDYYGLNKAIRRIKAN